MSNYDLTYEGSEVQSILDTGDKLREDGYILMGGATPSTLPGTPTKRVAYIGGPGSYSNFGTTTVVPSGSIGVFKYTGSAWSNEVIACTVPVSTSVENNDTTVPTGKAVKSVTDNLQTAINTLTTKLAEGYVYVGIATATTNPGTPTGKVFYIATAAGTYTNFLDSGSAALVLTQGINILKFNGTAWAVEQLWGVDDAPTPSSNKLVKSGGVFNDIMTNGSAFDLSAYNNGTTYADLNAALTALNALPAAFKKGGMSMKFVLTSDNKYVQYFCNSRTFTTNGGYWQKQNIDTKDLLTDSIAPEWLNYELKNGFYYNGTIEGANENWRRCKIDISNVSLLKFKTELWGSDANCCVTDKNGNVLKTWVFADLPSDKFVIFDLSSLTNPKYFYYSAYLNNFTENDIYIKGLAYLASLHELKDAEAYATGYKDVDCGELSNIIILTNNAPTETASNYYGTTGYLPVSEGDEIKVLSYCSSGGFVITGYSSQNQESYVSTFSVYGKNGPTEAVWFNAKIPSGVNYIRVTSDREYLVKGKIVIKRKVTNSIDSRLFPIDGKQLIFLNNPYLIDVKGTLVSSGGSGYYCSDFIELNEYDSYKLIGIRGTYGCLLVSFYSSQNQEDFIGQAITGDDGAAERTITFTVPKGGKYARFCGNWDIPHPQPVTLIRANEGYRIATNENRLLPSNRTLLDFPHTASRKPMILFQMDMAKAAYSQKIIDYADILDTNKIKRSTYCVLPEFLGHDAYTNFDFWMNTLYNRGNEVALHTGPDYNFSPWSTMTDAQVEAAMKDYLDRLEAKGYKSTGFIPLAADLKLSFKPIIQKYMSWMVSGNSAENIPADRDLMEDDVMNYISSLQTDRFQILRICLECVHEDASTEMHAAMLQKAKDVVDETIERGGYTIFYSHTYNQTVGTTYTLYPELFIPLCEYIKNKIDNRQIVTGNTNEMLEWYYTPRVGE